MAYAVTMNCPDWKEDLPVLRCIIDPDGGARMYGQLTGCAPDKARIGIRRRQTLWISARRPPYRNSARFSASQLYRMKHLVLDVALTPE